MAGFVRYLLAGIGIAVLALTGAMAIGIYTVPVGEIPAINFKTLSLTEKPNQYLVCPPGICTAESHRPSPSYDMSVDAFGDARFPPLKQKEFDRLKVSVSILGPLSPISISKEADLLRLLVPGRDGLALSEGTHRALFLPQVWQMLPQPKDFMRHLKLKVGLPEHYWSDAMVAYLFEVSSVGDPEI